MFKKTVDLLFVAMIIIEEKEAVELETNEI